MWETHSTPEYGERPQAIVNKQIVDSCDALIGTFWTRLGSPTGEALSGTVEEIERIHKSGRPVMLYFSSRHADIGKLDTDQLQALRSFKSSCKERGLFDEYATIEELSRRLTLGLTRLVDRLSETTVSNSSAPTDPKAAADSRTRQVSVLRQMQVKWKLNTKLRAQGHDDCKALMEQYSEWYVGNHEVLNAMSPSWEVLADLANQLTHYQFVAGPESSERFYEFGAGVLAISLSLMESGTIEPTLDDLGTTTLQFLLESNSQDDRQNMSAIASGIGAAIEDAERAVLELERLELANSLFYVGRGKAVGLSGSGFVRAVVNNDLGLTRE
jgi:hypothetical protein